MIEARDERVSAPSSHRRRRSTAKTGRRGGPIRSNGAGKALRVARVFSDAAVKPFDQVEWERRTAEIADGDAGAAAHAGALSPYAIVATTSGASAASTD